MADADKERARALAALKDRATVVRWGKELDRLLALFAFYLDGAEKQAMEGFGYKNLGIDDKTVTRLKGLTEAAKSITTSKVAYDKAEKALGDGLTPEQEREWVRKWVMGMENEERRAFIIGLLKSHRTRTAITAPKNVSDVVEPQPEETDAPDDSN